jgi:hypothetical protein
LPLFLSSAASSGVVPSVLYLCVLLFSFLPAYRVLSVWVYDRTQSLLIVMLMHIGLTAGTVILQPVVAGVPVSTYDLVFAGVLWAVVAALALANRRQPVQPPLQRQVA